MSLYTQFIKSIDDKDMTLYASLLHEDYKFVRHQTGTSMDKNQLVEMVKMMINSDAVHFLSRRCVYENEDVMVEHNVMDFADGTREAVMVVHLIKEGLIMQTETGATKIDKEA